MPVPISHKLSLFATPLLRGDDFVLCCCGDSQTADCLDSTAAPSTNQYVNYLYGIIRSWLPPAWSGLGQRGAYFAHSETTTSFGSDSTSNATHDAIEPGETAVGGAIDPPCPKQMRQWLFTGNTADGVTMGFCDWTSGGRTLSFTGNSTGTSDVLLTGLSGNHRMHTGQLIHISAHSDAQLNDLVFRASMTRSTTAQIRVQTAGNPAASDAAFTGTIPSQWASGDWFSGVHMAGRLILYKSATAGMLTQFKLQGRRNGAGVNTSAVKSAADATGLTYIQHNMSNGSGYPGLSWITDTGFDETGMYMLVGGYGIFKHDGSGNRTSGLYVCDIGQTGMSSTGLLGALGSASGTLAAPLSSANVEAYLGAHHSPKYWLLRIGYNATAAELAEYAGGTADVFKANVQACIDEIRLRHTALGHSGLPVILLVAQYMAGTDAYAALRAQALYELARANQGVCFFNEYAAMGKSTLSPAILSWWTADGVHPSPDGAAYIAGLLWAALAENYAVSSGSGATAEGSTGPGMQGSRAARTCRV